MLGFGVWSVFRSKRVEVENSQRWAVEVQILTGWLEVRCCFAAAASSWRIHILDDQVDAGLTALKVCGGNRLLLPTRCWSRSG